MPSSVERELDRLHIRYLEAVYSMCDRGAIDKDQRDKLIDLLEHIDEYSHDEFIKAWQEVLES